mgnify:CR=1 FL=1
MGKFEYLGKIFNVFGYNRGDSVDTLKSMLLDLYRREKGIYILENGRAAEYLFLKACGVDSQNNVAIQAFTCNAVVNPILWLGSSPLYIDVDMDSFTMNVNSLKDRIDKNTKVIIVQHTFSNTAKIKEIVEFAHSRGIYVLEDCAHSLGIHEHGILGDAMFISFGIDKTLSTRVGGALIINNYKILDSIESKHREIQGMDIVNSFLWLINPLLWQILRRSANLYSPLLKLLLGLKLLNIGHVNEELNGSLKNYSPKKLSNVLAAVVVDQLKELENNISHRKSINEVYEKELNIKYLGKHTHKFSIYINPATRDECVNILAEMGYVISKIYTNVISPKEVDLDAMKYTYNCPNAEELVKGIVNLPNSFNIGVEDAVKISKIIKKYL